MQNKFSLWFDKVRTPISFYLKSILAKFKPIGEWRNRWARLAGMVALGCLVFLCVPIFVIGGAIRGAEDWWDQMEWVIREAEKMSRKDYNND